MGTRRLHVSGGAATAGGQPHDEITGFQHQQEAGVIARLEEHESAAGGCPLPEGGHQLEPLALRRLPR